MKKLQTIFSKKILRYSLIVFVLLLLFVVTSNIWVNSSTSRFIYNDVAKIPYHKVTMVLGTGKYLKGGSKNLFFEYRIQAAVELFQKQKTSYFVVSGDNSSRHYNEPEMMKEEMVKRGVPACRIYCDYAGFRTFDSVIRMKKIFGQTSFIVVSQEFHNQRAVFLGRNNSINIIGFNARDVKGMSGIETHLREYFARTKAVIDIFIWPAKPKFLGAKVSLVDCN